MRTRKGVSTPLVIVAIVVLVIVAIAGTYAIVGQSKPSTSTTTSTAISTVTSTTTSVATSTSTATSVSTSTFVSTATQSSSSLTPSGTIIIEETASPDTLDPAGGTGVASSVEATQQVYQPLVAYGTNSSTIYPLLASNFTISPDGLTYTFTIRTGVTFSNGNPLNAYCVWYSIYRTAVMNQPNSPAVTTFINPAGVTAAMLNEFTNSNNVPPSSLIQSMQSSSLSITVPSPTQVVVHLATSAAPFLSELMNPTYNVVDPYVVTSNGGVTANASNTWMINNAVGTGPYMITSFQPNTLTQFQINPTYWGGANGIQPNPTVENIIVKVVPDTLTSVEDLERNTAQITFISNSQVPQITGQAGLYIPGVGQAPYVQYIGMDTKSFPFNNTLIREAVVHAVNESEILQQYYGLAESYLGPDIHGALGYSSTLQPYAFNTTLSEQLLKQAGFPNGTGIPPITLLFATNRPPSPDVAVVIQANLAAIGIKVSLDGTTAAQRNTIITGTSPTSSSYPALTYLTVGGGPDPFNWIPYTVGPQGRGAGLTNSAQYDNPTVDLLSNESTTQSNPVLRAQIIENLTSIVYKDAPYIWLAQLDNAFLVGVPLANIHVGGMVPNYYFSDIDFSRLYLV